MTDLVKSAAAAADVALGLHEQPPISATDREAGELLQDVANQAREQFARGNPKLAVLQLVAKAGLLTADQLADRLFRSEAEDLLRARTRANATLHRLVLAGYLEKRAVAYELAGARTPADVGRSVGGVAFDHAFTVTRKASEELKLAAPVTIRDSFITHQVKTMEAVWQVERSYRLRGYEVVSWKTENELIREQFRGKVFDSSGVVIPKFPDAQLVVQGPDGCSETVNVEYVSRGYSDKMIAEKREAFGATRTVWAVSAGSPGTAERVRAITGEEPLAL
jgi:hypothetical protein